MGKIVSVIPIKLKNERLPDKNIKLLGNKSLLFYIQEALLQVSEIDERYVYCSNDAVCSYLEKGISFLQRPAFLDENTTNFTQIFEEFSKVVKADIYVYAHATAPFSRSETIAECIEKVLNDSYDSAFTAVKIQDFLWKDGQAWNFDASNVPRSQDLDVIYRETSGVYVFRKEVFEQYRRRVGIRPYIKQVGYREAVDINTLADFKLAERLL